MRIKHPALLAIGIGIFTLFTSAAQSPRVKDPGPRPNLLQPFLIP